MKINTLVFLVSVGMSAVANAQSGSHGTSGEVCGNEFKIIDFKELARQPYLRQFVSIIEKHDAVETQINKAIQRLPEYLRLQMKNAVYGIKAKAIGTTIDWGYAKDLDYYPPEEGCKPKALISYFDKDNIQYNTTFQKMMNSNTQEAMAWVHEGFSVIFRKYNPDEQNTTLYTRRMTQLSFSEIEQPDLLNYLADLKFQTKKLTVEMAEATHVFKVKYKSNSEERFRIHLNCSGSGKTEADDPTFMSYEHLYEPTYVENKEEKKREITIDRVLSTGQKTYGLVVYGQPHDSQDVSFCSLQFYVDDEEKVNQTLHGVFPPVRKLPASADMMVMMIDIEDPADQYADHIDPITLKRRLKSFLYGI